MEIKELTPAAKIYLMSGKIPALKTGFTLFKSPTGEGINEQKLADLLLSISLLNLLKTNKIEMREEQKKALLGSYPLLHFTGKETKALGLEGEILDELKDGEKDLIKICVGVVGGVVMMPEYSFIRPVEEELSYLNLFETKETTNFFKIKKQEKFWDIARVTEMNKQNQPEIESFYGELLSAPWGPKAVRNFHMSFAQTREQREDDDD